MDKTMTGLIIGLGGKSPLANPADSVAVLAARRLVPFVAHKLASLPPLASHQPSPQTTLATQRLPPLFQLIAQYSAQVAA
ncbi:hypothetical protein Nepgr_005526 [Nepenthes gracilis]|uniref:Uncharacterized protein n=1 Tax=Nepenthes gracilis TaxID=150966 RepID=A0AAD3XGI8_NEPGR|nr:hypothetical protein Nepgr_005526 [Nepenthes gracilis]